jgi:hypothetical protein
MPLWGSKPKVGISDYELKDKHKELINAMDSAFSHHSSSIREQKRAILHTALGLTLDRDADMPSSQKRGVIEPEEFNQMLDSFEKGGIFSKDEVTHLRNATRDALNN